MYPGQSETDGGVSLANRQTTYTGSIQSRDNLHDSVVVVEVSTRLGSRDPALNAQTTDNSVLLLNNSGRNVLADAVEPCHEVINAFG